MTILQNEGVSKGQSVMDSIFFADKSPLHLAGTSICLSCCRYEHSLRVLSCYCLVLWIISHCLCVFVCVIDSVCMCVCVHVCMSVCAARGGHTDCLRLLLERGASVHVTDLQQSTPLHEACAHHHEACVVRLTSASLLLWFLLCVNIFWKKHVFNTRCVMPRRCC